MSWIKGREVPIMIIAFVMLINLTEYYVDFPLLNVLAQDIRNWGVIISIFAVGIGVISIISLHGLHISRRDTGWPFSLWLLMTMLIMVVSGIQGTIATHPIFTWLFSNIQVPLQATFYSILAPFIFSAGFRAFRARNIESGLLLIAACLVMLKNAPIGASIWVGFPLIGKWLYDVPNAAGMRAVIIGAAIGTIVLGIRTLLGHERGVIRG